MARRPRTRRTNEISQGVTESVIEDYSESRQVLVCRYVVDGKTYRKRFRGTENDSTLHDQLLIKGEEEVVQSLRKEVYSEFDRDLADGLRTWADLPEDTQEERDAKQRYAQGVMRIVVDHTHKGGRLNQKGSTRPSASTEFMSTVPYKKNIWDEVQLMFATHPERAEYLALSGPGPDSEYNDITTYFN